MSDNKLLNENTVRRFMKLANVQTLTDNFIQEKYTKEEALEEQMDPMEEEEPAAEEEGMEPEAVEEEPVGDDMGEPEMEMGAADISLTEEEAELLIDLGERLKEAMDSEMDDEMGDEMDDEMGDEMEEPMADEPEEPMGDEAPDTEEAAGYRAMQENKDEIVREVLKRVTKRIISNRK